MSQPKQCAIYVRVSTDTQAEKDFSSCQSQEEKILWIFRNYPAKITNTVLLSQGGQTKS